MNTSTVDGTTASPLAASSGVVTNVGCVAKFVPNCTPPKRTERPQAPGALIPSPTRIVASRSGMSRVKVVSRRVGTPPLELVPRQHGVRNHAGCAEEPELEQRAALVEVGNTLSRQVVVTPWRDRRRTKGIVGQCRDGGHEGVRPEESAPRSGLRHRSARPRRSTHRLGDRKCRRRARSATCGGLVQPREVLGTEGAARRQHHAARAGSRRLPGR